MIFFYYVTLRYLKSFRFFRTDAAVKIYKIILMAYLEIIESPLPFQVLQHKNLQLLALFSQIPNFLNYKTKRNKTNMFYCHRIILTMSCKMQRHQSKKNHGKGYNLNSAKQNNTWRLIIGIRITE